MAIRKVKYLNNADLLKEIHRSKKSFCYFIDEQYNEFDGVLQEEDVLTIDVINEARAKRATRITKAAQLKLREANDTVTKEELYDLIVTPEDVPLNEVVFRRTTYDHIPLDLNRKRKARSVAEHHIKLNFIPFKHYILECNDGKPIPDKNTFIVKEVGRSHWKDGLENGYFCTNHGNITNNLARMFMKLVERFGMRGNWRGYTYNDEMKNQAILQLVGIGLRFDEARFSNPFAYYTAVINNSFTRVLNDEKHHQLIRDDLLMASGEMPSFSRQIDHEMKERAAAEAERVGAETATKTEETTNSEEFSFG